MSNQFCKFLLSGNTEMGRVYISDSYVSFKSNESDSQVIMSTKSLLEALRKKGLTDYYKK